MTRLEQLTQDDSGSIRRTSTGFRPWRLSHIGRMQMITVKNPCINISTVINEMQNRNSPLIPREANAYVVSDFSPDAQFLIKDHEGKENTYSCYAAQFYFAEY